MKHSLRSNPRRWSWRASPFAALACLVVASPAFAAVASLDDVDYWVGSGSKRAALVIDWSGDSAADQSLAWGYRWDGAAQGIDMLTAVAAADPRLYAKLRTPDANGIGVFGLGYDLNDDGAFALSDETEFDDGGIAYIDAADDFVNAGPVDSYREGWFLGVWGYGVADANPWSTTWFRAPFGPSARELVDGSWDSWAFMSPIRPGATVFAANPVAAAPPADDDADFDADFDGDGDRDGADFLAWQRGVGTTSGALQEDGDANGDEAVNGLDLDIWKSQFALANAAGVPTTNIVPEPASLALAAWIIFAVLRFTSWHGRRPT